MSACRPGDLLRLPDGALAIAGSRRPNEDLPAFVIRLAAGSTDAIPVMHDHESGPDNAIVSDEDVLTMPSPSIRVHHEVSPSCSLQTLATPGMIALTHDGYLLIYKQDDTLRGYNLTDGSNASLEGMVGMLFEQWHLLDAAGSELPMI